MPGRQGPQWSFQVASSYFGTLSLLHIFCPLFTTSRTQLDICHFASERLYTIYSTCVRLCEKPWKLLRIENIPHLLENRITILDNDKIYS